MDEQLKLLFDKYRAAGNSETPEQFLEAKTMMGDEKFFSFVNTQIDVKKKVDPQSYDQAIVPETVVDQLQGNPINQDDQRFAQTVTEPLQPINVNQNSTELGSTLATPSTELGSTSNQKNEPLEKKENSFIDNLGLYNKYNPKTGVFSDKKRIVPQSELDSILKFYDDQDAKNAKIKEQNKEIQKQNEAKKLLGIEEAIPTVKEVVNENRKDSIASDFNGIIDLIPRERITPIGYDPDNNQMFKTKDNQTLVYSENLLMIPSNDVNTPNLVYGRDFKINKFGLTVLPDEFEAPKSEVKQLNYIPKLTFDTEITYDKKVDLGGENSYGSIAGFNKSLSENPNYTKALDENGKPKMIDDSFVFKIKTQDELDRANEENAKLATQINYYNRDLEFEEKNKVQRVNDLAVFETEKKEEQIKKFGANIVNKYDGLMTPEEVQFEEDAILINNLVNQGYDANQANAILLQRKEEANLNALESSKKWSSFIDSTAQELEESRKSNALIDLGENTYTSKEKQAWAALSNDPEFGKFMDSEGKIFFGDVDSGLAINSSSTKLRKQIVDKFLVWKNTNDADYRDAIIVKDEAYKRKIQTALSTGDLETVNELRNLRQPIQQSISNISGKISKTAQEYSTYNNFFDTLKKEGEDAAREYAGYQNGDISDIVSYTSKGIASSVFNVATDLVGGIISTAGLASENLANTASAFKRDTENPFGILKNGISDKYDVYEKDGKRIEIRFGNAFKSENGKLIFDEGLTNNLKDVKEQYNFVKSGNEWNIAATSSMIVEQGLMMLLPELAAARVSSFAASSGRFLRNSAKIASYFGETSTIGKAAVNYTKYVKGTTSSLVWGEQVFAQNVETGRQAGLDIKQAWAYGALQSLGTMALIHISPDSKIFNAYKDFNANAFRLISQNKWEEFKILSTQAAKTILKSNVREGLQESTEQSFMYGVNAIYNKVSIDDKDKKLTTGNWEEWKDMLQQTAIVTTFLGSVGLARGGKLGLSSDSEKLAQYIIASKTDGIDAYLDEVQNSSWLNDRSKQVQEAKDIIATVRQFVNQIPEGSNLNISESTEVVKNLQRIDALKNSQKNTTSDGIVKSIQADIDSLNLRVEQTLNSAKERNLKESEKTNNKPFSFDDYDTENNSEQEENVENSNTVVSSNFDNDNQNTNPLEPALESEEGQKLYHVSNSVLTIDDVDVEPRRSRQSKRATSGGFYTYDNKEDVQKFGARNKSSNVHEITLNPGVEIKDYDGSIERLYAEDLARLRSEGYKVIRGKSIFGKEEIVVIDKSAIKSVENIGDQKSENDANTINNEKQATTETEQATTIPTEPLNEVGNTTTENNISSEIENPQVTETKLDETLFDDEVELDEEKQATASVQLDDAISLLESLNSNQDETTSGENINGNGDTRSEPNSVYENGQGRQEDVVEITEANEPRGSETEVEVNPNAYTRNGKTYTQDENGDFYTNDKNGKNRKVTNKATVNDLKELSNARREESLVSSKEKNGYTYKKYSDGSEIIITPKGKEVNKNFNRKIDRNRSKTVPNGNFSKLYSDIFGEETNAQATKKQKAERDIALRNFTPRNAYEYALLYFANGGKVSTDSVKKEVTGNNQKITDYKWAWFTKGNNTTSFENIGELAHNSGEFSHLDSNEIRNEAIEIVRNSSNIRELQDKVMEMYYGNQESSHNGMSLQEQEEYFAEMSPEELYDFNKSFLSPKELSLLEATEAEASLDEAEQLEYYQNLFENHLNSLSNEEQDELYAKPTNKGTDGPVQSESESVSSSEKQSSNSTNSPEYKELLKQKAEKEAEVKSAKENLNKVSKATNKNFQDDQTDLFGERKSEDNSSLFDERADADAAKEIIQKAKERHNSAKKDLAETNARIKDFESGKTNGTSEIQFQETKQSFPTLAKEAFDALIDRLKKPFAKAFKNLNVTTDLDAAKKRAEELGEDISQLEFKNKNGNVYGFKLSDGTIYIDPTKLNANTAIHEFSHLWEQLMPSAWKKGLEIFKQTNTGKKLFDELKKEGNYSELSDEQIWSEALNTHLGNEGATEYNRTPKGKMAEFKEWVKKAFARLGTALGIKTSPETSLQEFTQNVLGDLLGGRSIIAEANESNNTGIQYSANGVNKRAMPKSTFAKIVNAIKTEGKEKGFEELENSVWFKSLEASKKDGITVDNFHQLVLEQAKIIQENDAIKKKEALDKAKEKKDQAVAKEKESSKDLIKELREKIKDLKENYKDSVSKITRLKNAKERLAEKIYWRKQAVNSIKILLADKNVKNKITNKELITLLNNAERILKARNVNAAFDNFTNKLDYIISRAEKRGQKKDEWQDFKDNPNSLTADPNVQYEKVKSKNIFIAFKEKWFSNQGGVMKNFMNIKDRAKGSINWELRIARNTVRDLQRTQVKLKFNSDNDNKNIDKALKGDLIAYDNLPDEIKPFITTMRNQIDRLSHYLVDNKLVTPDQALEISNNIGTYTTRGYEYFDGKLGTLRTVERVSKTFFRFMFKKQGTLKSEFDIEKWSEAVTVFQQNILNDIASDIQFNKGNKYGQDFHSQSEEDIQSYARSEGESKLMEYIKSLEADYQKQGSAQKADTSVLERKKEVPLPIRKLLGEFEDPKVSFALTISRMSQLAYQRKFMSELKKLGLGTLFFEANDPKKPATHYVKIASDSNDGYSPLSGLYTTPEFKDVFLDVTEQNINDIGRLWMKATGLVKVGKTVLSPVTQMVNFMANPGFLINNGTILDIKQFGASVRVFIDDMKSSSDTNPIIQELIEENIIGQSLAFNEIESDFGANLERDFMRSINQSKVTKTARDIMSIPFKAYRASDDFFKAFTYYAEANRYAKAIFGKDYKNLTGSDRARIRKIASEVTKNTMPNYDRRYKAADYARMKTGNLLGNFLSFQAESIRNKVNSIQIAIADVKNPETRSVGVQRMAGILTYNAIYASVTAYLGKLSGLGFVGLLGFFDDDDEDKDNSTFNKIVPDWARSTEKYARQEKDGTITFYTYGNSNPYGIWYKTVNSYKNGSQNNVDGGILSVMDEITTPFFGTEMSAQWALNTFVKEKNDWGADLITWEDKSRYTWEKLSPTFFKVYKDNMDENDKNNFDIYNGIGVKKYNFDPTMQLGFKFKDWQQKVNSIGRKKYTLETQLKNGKISQEDAETRIKEYTEEQTEVTDEFRKTYEAFIWWGAKRNELIKKANKSYKFEANPANDFLNYLNIHSDFSDKLPLEEKLKYVK